MTDLQILNAVKNNNGSIEYTALLNQSLTDAYIDGSADKARISKLIEAGLLAGETRAFCSISITDEGRLRLQGEYYSEEQNKKLAKKAANDKTNERRHEWHIAFGSAFFAGLIGLAFEVVAFFFLK